MMADVRRERVIGGAKIWAVGGEAAIGEEGERDDGERDGRCVCACVCWGVL